MHEFDLSEAHQLVRHVAVVLARKLLANGTLHETGQGRQDVDWRVDLSVVQLTIDENLPLSDVTRQVWNRMCDI